jgi:uncharacterized protein YkwD
VRSVSRLGGSVVVGDSAPALAYTAIMILGGALGGVVYLGTRTGPATEPHGTVVAGSNAPPAAPPTGAMTFVASADLSAEEQVMLERLNQVRANPPAFVGEWTQMLAKMVGASRCEEPLTMLDPIKGYQARQPLAANQQLTNAARAHGRDEIARGYFEHVNPDGIGSNQRLIAAGFPLPVGAPMNGFTYGGEQDAVNTESIHMSDAVGAHAFGPNDWLESIDELIVDACVPSRGHRLHLLGVQGTSVIEPEIGIGGVTGISSKTKHSELQVVIETATKNDGLYFVLGVVYRDANDNGRYDRGEGVPGVQIDLAAAGVTTKTAPGGGYALPVHDGVAGELTTPGGVKLPFAIKGANVKLDVKIP